MGTITENFSYWEFERSETADRNGLVNAITSAAVRDHVKELTESLLQPLRDAWGGGLIVSSGYRCPELNRLVGGKETSAHRTGYAADLVPENGRVGDFFDFSEKWLMASGRPFDQYIQEHTADRRTWWLHLSLKGMDGRQRGQVIKDCIK